MKDSFVSMEHFGENTDVTIVPRLTSFLIFSFFGIRSVIMNLFVMLATFSLLGGVEAQVSVVSVSNQSCLLQNKLTLISSCPFCISYL